MTDRGLEILCREIVGTQLKRFRRKARASQWDISAFLGYGTAQFVSNWERGKSLPPEEAIPVIAAYYDVKLKELLDPICRFKLKQIERYRHRVMQLAKKKKKKR